VDGWAVVTRAGFGVFVCMGRVCSSGEDKQLPMVKDAYGIGYGRRRRLLRPSSTKRPRRERIEEVEGSVKLSSVRGWMGSE